MHVNAAAHLLVGHLLQAPHTPGMGHDGGESCACEGRAGQELARHADVQAPDLFNFCGRVLHVCDLLHHVLHTEP
eukprot:1156209-Pelagomonas_calceolata.AAC.1